MRVAIPGCDRGELVAAIALHMVDIKAKLVEGVREVRESREEAACRPRWKGRASDPGRSGRCYEISVYTCEEIERRKLRHYLTLAEARWAYRASSVAAAAGHSTKETRRIERGTRAASVAR